MLPTNLSASWVPNKTTKNRLVLFFGVKREWFKNTGPMEHLHKKEGFLMQKSYHSKVPKESQAAISEISTQTIGCQGPMIRSSVSSLGENGWKWMGILGVVLPFCGVFFVQKMRDWSSRC